MNKQDLNRYQMLENTLKYLVENASAYEGDTTLKEGVARLKENLTQTAQILDKIEVLDLPFTEMKDEVRDRFADEFMKLLLLLRQINVSKNDNEIVLLQKTTYSELRYGRIIDNLTRGRAIFEKAEEYLNEIKSFHNGEALFQEKKDILEVFIDFSNKPLERIAKAKSLRYDLDLLLTKTQSLCANELDGLVAIHSSNESFFFGYENNRRIRKTNSSSETETPPPSTEDTPPVASGDTSPAITGETPPSSTDSNTNPNTSSNMG